MKNDEYKIFFLIGNGVTTFTLLINNNNDFMMNLNPEIN